MKALASNAGPWVSLRASAKELQCAMTLVNGQCFNWHRNSRGEWTGVVGNCLIGIKQEYNDVLYMEKFPGNTPTIDAQLRDYFQLDRFKLETMYDNWAEADPRFKEIAQYIRGVRVLRQDPVECLFSFLCSQNNHISRTSYNFVFTVDAGITGMLSRLRETYGTPLCVDEAGQQYYTFPTLNRLQHATEQRLRSLGFGYRAKYVVETAKRLKEKGGEEWLLDLRTRPRQEVQAELLELNGVGKKVADCVALFSLDQYEAVPVDTHVWQIASKDYKQYLPTLHKAKSLTDTIYRQIGDFFRAHFRTRAGWAHSVLFTAHLASFREYLPRRLWSGVASSKAKKEKKSSEIAGDKEEKEEEKEEDEVAPPSSDLFTEAPNLPQDTVSPPVAQKPKGAKRKVTIHSYSAKARKKRVAKRSLEKDYT